MISKNYDSIVNMVNRIQSILDTDRTLHPHDISFLKLAKLELEHFIDEKEESTASRMVDHSYS